MIPVTNWKPSGDTTAGEIARKKINPPTTTCLCWGNFLETSEASK